MQTVGVILVILNILTIAAPIAVVAVNYQNNLSELVIPSEISQLMNNTFPSGLEVKLPTIVNVTSNNLTQTVTLTVNFTNPVNYNLTLKEITANIQCQNHNFSLGKANISEPTQIPALQTIQLIIFFNWTPEAENHFQSEHLGATSLAIKIVDLSVNMNEIMIQIPQTIGPIEVPFTLQETLTKIEN